MGSCYAPASNILERSDEFIVEMAIPGFEKKDLVIDLDQNVLKISSKREFKFAEGDEVLRNEFSRSAFERSFELPDTVDADNINAGYENGVLTIHIPKMEFARTKPPREISIA
jgi:HSP20 family protein